MKSKNVLNKVVNVCGKVVSERQEHLSQLCERRVVRKARVIVDDNIHVLAKHYELLPSGRRFRLPKSNSSVLAYPVTLSNISLTSHGQCRPRLTSQLQCPWL